MCPLTILLAKAADGATVALCILARSRVQACAYACLDLSCVRMRSCMHACMLLAHTQLAGPIPEAVGAKAADAVVTALAYLNKERKQIHRDVKPSNILVNAKGMHGVCRDICAHMHMTYVRMRVVCASRGKL